MTKLEELIQEFCPNGVEYKPLWSLTAWDKRFNGIDRSMQKKVVSYKYYLSSEFNEVERRDGDILYIPTGITNEKRYTTEELAGEYLAEGEIVCIPWGGTPNVKYHKGKFVTGDNRIATSLDTNILDNKYLYYWMQSKIDLIASFYRGAGIQHPSMKSVLELQIPLPALPVQREIARILDSFTLYSAELTAELTARRKQYEFYRDKLLNFANQQMKVRMCSMGDLGKFYGGISGKTKDDFKDGNAKFISYKNVYFNPALNTNIDEKVKIGINEHQRTLEYGDIIFTGSSETPDECGLSSVVTETVNEKLYLNSFCFFFRFDNKKMILPGFAKYLFRSTEIRRQIVKTASGVTRYNVSKEKMAKVQIPIPPIEVQERIVNVLDNFDAICSDLGIGLPAEIEKRQKQYEYYREKLLTFDNRFATILDRQTDRQG